MTPDDPPEMPIAPADLAGLRWLKGLVTALTVTMIAAGLVVIFLMITRWPSAPSAPELFLPDTLELPDGATVLGVTRGTDWWAIVTQDSDGAERIMIYGADGGLRQNVEVVR